MTRINVVPPSMLTDKHLLAEYRELPRVFRLARECKDAPTSYTLGKGHVKFFYDKLLFLYYRQCQIVWEMAYRGLKANYSPATLLEFVHTNAKLDLLGDYTPTAYAKAINLSRICVRLAGAA